jgi:hypothetical protein
MLTCRCCNGGLAGFQNAFELFLFGHGVEQAPQDHDRLPKRR